MSQESYMDNAQNTIVSGWKVKMLAIPTARQMIIDKMPSLVLGQFEFYYTCRAQGGDVLNGCWASLRAI